MKNKSMLKLAILLLLPLWILPFMLWQLLDGIWEIISEFVDEKETK